MLNKPAAAGKNLRRLRLPALSGGNDSLRYPQVTDGNFPAPAGNLGEAFIVPVKSAFFKKKGEKDVSFYPVPNTLTKVTTCCFSSQW